MSEPWYASLAHGKRMRAVVDDLLVYRAIKAHRRELRWPREVLTPWTRARIRTRSAACRFITVGAHWWKPIGVRNVHGWDDEVSRCRLCRSTQYRPVEDITKRADDARGA